MAEEVEISPDVVMARRFALDQEIAAIALRHKADLAPLTEELELCETFIRDFMLKSGSQQYKTAAGDMAFFVDKDSVTVKDMNAVIHTILAAAPCPPADSEIGRAVNHETWPGIIQYIEQHGLWMLLKKDVNKTAVKEVINGTKAAVAGVEFSSYRGLNWRRGKAA